jgi:hypothetical protein
MQPEQSRENEDARQPNDHDVVKAEPMSENKVVHESSNGWKADGRSQAA